MPMGRFRGLRPLLVATLVVGIFGTKASAWGPHGHRLATRVAEGRLTPEAAKAVRELLNSGDTLVGICDWADHEGHDVVPGSAPWHYVNVPISAERYEERDCPPRGCVVSKIREYRKVLADPHAPRKERQLALLFLVHFVEDVHQPLHVGDNRDHGGNDTQVRFRGRGTNLHRLWDSDLIDHVDFDDRQWMERIQKSLTPEHVAEWSKGNVEDWANESLAAAKTAYKFPPGTEKDVRVGLTLTEDYARLARPIVEDRLARAGVRLANELNALFR